MEIKLSIMQKENYYLAQKEPHQSCLLALRDIILSQDADIEECVKYGVPCFTINGKPVFYIMLNKKQNQPYVLFVKGIQIDHPKLDQGDRKQMKVYWVDPEKDIDLEELVLVLNLALKLEIK